MSDIGIIVVAVAFALVCVMCLSFYRSTTAERTSDRRVTTTNSNAPSSDYAAVVVGCENYGGNGDLPGCVEDARRFEHLIISQYAVGKTRRIENATKKDVIEGLNWLSQQQESNLVFFYSGHGTREYTASTTESDNSDEGLYLSDSQILLDNEINSILLTNLKPESTLTLFFDCCHSGTMADLQYKCEFKEDNQALLFSQETNPTQRPNEVDIFCFSASRDPQVSLLMNNGSLYTNALLAALKQNPDISRKQLLQAVDIHTNVGSSYNTNAGHPAEQRPVLSCNSELVDAHLNSKVFN